MTRRRPGPLEEGFQGLMPMATGLVIDRAGLATGAICFAVALAVIAVAGGFFVGRNLAEAEDQP